MNVRFAALGSLALGLMACTSTAPQPPAKMPFSGLSGTSWQLVEFQSMADVQGTERPSKPSNYTITFGENGNLSARLDCNRATGSWSNNIANATGGSLTFGPLAVTRALCPEPTMGERLERHLPYVRSFVVRDGNLHMALMADGGLIVWEPVESMQ